MKSGPTIAVVPKGDALLVIGAGQDAAWAGFEPSASPRYVTRRIPP
ncbi:MAG: hypothetical protein K0Q60_4089 [Microvirga sp.]|jgi:hypothetical protein|nr:hypothetical protein [Microvirga sp.]